MIGERRGAIMIRNGDMDLVRTELPEQFKEEMKALLGEDFQAYLDSFGRPAPGGLRVNTLKWTPEEAAERLPALRGPVPWCGSGFYYDGTERISRHPYYYAGLYYLQEPSAMAPARILPVEPGNRVLDLCAAPGGKSTELGARLKGRGFLAANDISASRAKGLLKNLELFGIPNICVTGEAPERLAEVYPEYFDSILADAPCSGEGMFRKNPEMVKDWMRRGPEYYAPVQRQILIQAADMLKPGGYLLYSTCTFSVLENEDNVRWLLEQGKQLELVSVPDFPGAERGVGMKECLRLYPHKVQGEGHFVALFRKGGQAGGYFSQSAAPVQKNNRIPEKESEFWDFLARTGIRWEKERFLTQGENVYYLPEGFLPAAGLRYLRTGLHLGTVKRGRFEPGQALAMALSPETYENCVNFACRDDRVIRYLKGETISLGPEEPERKGWCLVCVDGFPLGFARGNGGSLKNKYYPGWRWM